VADLKKRIAQYLRMLGASDGERRTAFVKLELAMRDAKVSWTDIGQARASNGNGNGHLVLPKPEEMAEYCHQQFGRLTNDWQRKFVADLFIITRRTSNLSLSRLANLAKIYIETGGRL
jgi:hypothetical protein